MKKKKIIALSLSSIVALSLVGCSSDVQEEAPADTTVETDTVVKENVEKENVEGTEETDVPVDMEVSLEDAIYENALNMQEENIESYMEDIVIPEEQVEVTKQALTQLFDALDATYEITNINVLEQTDTTAKVEVTQVTKAVPKTEGFQDNETISIHTLELVDEKWKFIGTEVKSINYL